MLINIILIIIGFILLIKGADVLVEGSSNIAKIFHVPEIIIGLTIVSIGTSMPELFVSLTSALAGSSDISIGNVVGSNICNLLLILGASAIIGNLSFQRSTIKVDIPLTLISTILLLLLANIGNSVSRIDGLIFLMCFILFILYTIYVAKNNNLNNKSNTHISKKKLFINLIYIALSIFFLRVGADVVVDNSVILARGLHITEKIIGLTIIALGTSLPELVTSVIATLKNNSDMAIGNIIGSCIFNILLILGLSSIISPITYNYSYNNDIFILTISIILLMVFSITGKKDKMTRSNGILYLIMYIVYITFLIIR